MKCRDGIKANFIPWTFFGWEGKKRNKYDVRLAGEGNGMNTIKKM